MILGLGGGPRAVRAADDDPGGSRSTPVGSVVTPGATGSGAPTAASSDASADDAGARQAADGAAPEHDDTRLAQSDAPPDVASYELRARLDVEAHTVHGEGTIRWTNASRVPVQELYVHLYLNAFKNQASVFMRAPIGGFRGDTVPARWGAIDVRRFALRGNGGEGAVDLWKDVELHRPDDDDETNARVPLPRPVAPGETIEVEVAWDDQLPSIVERTGFDRDFHMVAQWFPKIAVLEPDGTFAHFPMHHLGEFYASFGRYDVTLDVPASFVVGATGTRVESRVEGERRIERRVQEHVHDFAWTAWDRFLERNEDVAGVRVTMLYPAGYDAVVEREMETIRFGIPHFGERYGSYPYDVLTIVHPPSWASEAGGMEYPTLITARGAAWSPPGIYEPELVTIHEFGHQYFYGLLASHETKWPFLDEGLNSYAETEAMGAWKGEGSFIDLFGLHVSNAEGHAELARASAADEPIAQPAYAFRTGASYQSLVYSRTATVLETLRRVYGDEAMRRTLRAYTRRFRFRHPTPDDLLRTFRAEMGERPAEILERALFHKGRVDFAVGHIASSTSHPPAGMFDVAGKRETVPSGRLTGGHYDGSVLVYRRGELELPVEIELVAEDGTRTRVPWDGAGDAIRVPYSGSSPLRAARVDPDRRILLDDHPENDFATAPGKRRAGAPRTLERVTYWIELLLGVVAP